MTKSKLTLPALAVAVSVTLASCGGSADAGSQPASTSTSIQPNKPAVDIYGNPIPTLRPGDPVVVPTPEIDHLTIGKVDADESYTASNLLLPVENNAILTQGVEYPAPTDEPTTKVEITSQQQQDLNALNKVYHDNTSQLNEQASMLIDPYGSVDINGLTYEKNTARLIYQGYGPVFLGKQIPVSSKNATNFNYLQLNMPEIKFNAGVGHFTGEGVKVATIDGELNPGDNYNKTPIKVNIDDIVGKKNYKPLAQGLDHGNRTGVIIAGKRVSGRAGIASGAQLYYAELPSETDQNGQLQLGKIIEKVYQIAHPVAINNSYFIPDSKQSTNINNTHITEDLLDIKYRDDLYAQALYGLQQVVKNNDAPLFVFSTGNYNPDIFYAYLKESKHQDQLVKALKEPNYGFGLRVNSSIAQFLTHKELQPNIIAVSGMAVNINNETRVNIFNTISSKISDNDTRTSIASKVPVPTKHTTDQYNSVVSAIGALQCGVVMYHCISANYYYYEPFYKNGNTPNVGTSFAAPQVTATAVLLKQQFPWMTAANLKDTILTTATDVGTPGIDQQFGWGVLNAANALRGPAMFAFGDFVANLNNTNQNSYFVNDISGAGGLVISGGDKDFLYLMGNNNYTGKTVVNSGNLVIASFNRNYVGDVIGKNKITQSIHAGVTSPIYVQHQGHLLVVNANTGNITNNGITSLYGSSYVNGDLVQKHDASLIVASNQVIYVKGTAYLDGTLALGYSAVQDQGYTVGNNQTFYKVLQADNIVGKFANKYLQGTALKDLKLVYATNNQLVAVNVIPKKITNVAVSLTAADSSVDQDQAELGAQYLEGVLTVADKVATPTGVHSLDDLMTNTAIASESRDHPASSPAVLTHTTGDVATTVVNSKPMLTPASLELTESNVATAATESSPASPAIAEPAHSTVTDSALAVSEQPTATPAPKTPAVVSLATHIQNANDQELKHLLLAQAASSYSDLQLASTSQARSRVTSFIDTASSSFLDASLDHYVRVYHNYSISQRDWSQPQTQLHGKQNLFGFTLGAYGQNQGINYGIALMHHQGDWHQGTNAIYQDNLANANIEMNGLDFTIGKALTTNYYSASLFANIHKYQVSRSSLARNDQQAKFYGQQFGINLQYGHKLYQGKAVSLVAKLGTTISYNNQSAFTEKAIGSMASQSSFLSLQVKSGHHLDWYVNTGLALKYHMMSFGYDTELSTALTVEQSLTKQRFNLELQNSLQTAHAFDQRFMAKLTAGYTVRVSDKLTVKLSGSLQKSTHHLVDKQGNLELSYAFDLH